MNDEARYGIFKKALLVDLFFLTQVEGLLYFYFVLFLLPQRMNLPAEQLDVGVLSYS